MRERYNVLQCPDLEPVWKSGHAVIATSAQLKKNLLQLITHCLSIFQSPLQSQPKNKHFPSIILHPNYILPTTPFYCSRASLCCDTPKKTVLLNVVDKHT